MTGKAHIEETALADDNLIATYAFKVIINAFMIARHSDEIMKVGKSKEPVKTDS